MQYFQPPTMGEGVPCPYLPDRTFVQEYFLAADLDQAEWGNLLRQGWRRFGWYFFRPACGTCRACESLRLPVDRLTPTASQRRVLRKNAETAVQVRPLEYKPEYFELYADHSRRFDGKEVDEEDFRQNFFTPAAPAALVEYRIGGELAAVGFVDLGDRELSSVYFIYKEKYAAWSLGTFSVFAESRLALENGFSFYNLGFWVRDNARMKYKGNFLPRELLDPETGQWVEDNS